MRKKHIVREKWLVSSLFRCTVCQKKWEKIETAAKCAAEHSRKTGHTVYGETAYHVGFIANGKSN